MLTGDRIDYQEAFQTFIQAFDQLNKERSHIINNQGDVIADFAERISKFDRSNKDVSKNGAVELHEYVRTLNNGDLFAKVNAQQSFNQIQHDDAKSKDVKSVTGSALGTNKLLETHETDATQGLGQKSEDFISKPHEVPREQVSPVLLVPSGMNPPSYKNPTTEADVAALREKWFDHQEKRRQLVNSGMSQSQADQAGYKNLTFDEYLQEHGKSHPVPPEQIQEEEDAKEQNKMRRLASLRLAKDIAAYHSQGKRANVDGFNVGGTGSTLMVETDLSQRMLVFGPSWRQVKGVSNISDDDLMLEVDAVDDDEDARKRTRQKKEMEAAK